jgi:23S rRNA pseudouridine2604 synthase
VPILGEMTKKCKVVKESVYSFRITLIQGLNRQIRRMCEHFDYEVVKLERIRIMNISLKGLPLGEWRQLLPDEMEQIMASVANSLSNDVKAKSQESRTKPMERVVQKSAQRAPASTSAKKPDRSSNPNPKSRDLRNQSSNSNGKKTGTAKHAKPFSDSFGSRKSGRR